MHRFLLRCAIVLALLIVPSLARADDHATEGAWYGYQTLLLDAAAVALYAGGAASDNFAVGAGGGGAIYLAGAPTAHLLHHNPRAAGKSLALRLLLPLGGAIAGGLLGAAVMGDGSYGGLAVVILGGAGAFLGAGVASLVDAFSYAYEPPPPAETSAARRLPAATMPVPVFSVTKNNTVFGLSASF